MDTPFPPSSSSASSSLRHHSSSSRASAPPDHMWEIMNRAPKSINTASTGASTMSDYLPKQYSHHSDSSSSSSSSSRPLAGGRSYSLTFPSVLKSGVGSSSSSSSSTLPVDADNKRVRFTSTEPLIATTSAPFTPMAPPPPPLVLSGSNLYDSTPAPVPSSSSSYPQRPLPDEVRMLALERGLSVVMDEVARLRASTSTLTLQQQMGAPTSTSRGSEAFYGAESPPRTSSSSSTNAAVSTLVRTVNELQDRIEGLEEQARGDKDVIALLVDKLRDNAGVSTSLRLALDEMRASMPLIKHQENDMLLWRREVDHRFGQESSRHAETQKKMEQLFREVTGLGDALSSRTLELSEGIHKFETQVSSAVERVQQTEAIIFRAQKRESDRMTELSREVATILEVLRTVKEDGHRLEETVATEASLRRQSGKQFLQVAEQVRERVGEVAERANRDLTDAVGQLNLRMSRIYDDLDNAVKEERSGREVHMRQVEKGVVVQVSEVENKVLQLQQHLSEARLKYVQLEETCASTTSRLDSDIQSCSRTTESARFLMMEEIKRFTNEKLSAALDASGRLNKGQHQSIEDLKELLRVEVDSRKNEQKEIRNGVEVLARDWMEEFEGFRTEFRRTSNALEVRIDNSEGDIMRDCLEQVASLEEALAARQNLLESVNETHVERLKTLKLAVDEENASLRQSIKAIESTFTEAIDAVQRDQVDMDSKIDHVTNRIIVELKEDRSAVYTLRRSLETTARMARQANETLSRPGFIPRLDTLRKLQEQITRVSTRVEVQEVLGRITEFIVDGYQSPPRTSHHGQREPRDILPHSPARQADIDGHKARQGAVTPPVRRSNVTSPARTPVGKDAVAPADTHASAVIRTPTRTKKASSSSAAAAFTVVGSNPTGSPKANASSTSRSALADTIADNDMAVSSPVSPTSRSKTPVKGYASGTSSSSNKSIASADSEGASLSNSRTGSRASTPIRANTVSKRNASPGPDTTSSTMSSSISANTTASDSILSTDSSERSLVTFHSTASTSAQQQPLASNSEWASPVQQASTRVTAAGDLDGSPSTTMDAPVEASTSPKGKAASPDSTHAAHGGRTGAASSSATSHGGGRATTPKRQDDDDDGEGGDIRANAGIDGRSVNSTAAGGDNDGGGDGGVDMEYEDDHEHEDSRDGRDEDGRDEDADKEVVFHSEGSETSLQATNSRGPSPELTPWSSIPAGEATTRSITIKRKPSSITFATHRVGLGKNDL